MRYPLCFALYAEQFSSAPIYFNSFSGRLGNNLDKFPLNADFLKWHAFSACNAEKTDFGTIFAILRRISYSWHPSSANSAGKWILHTIFLSWQCNDNWRNISIQCMEMFLQLSFLSCSAVQCIKTNTDFHFSPLDGCRHPLSFHSVQEKWTLSSVSHSFVSPSPSISTCSIFGSEKCFRLFIVKILYYLFCQNRSFCLYRHTVPLCDRKTGNP